jgi:hypothetical protein
MNINSQFICKSNQAVPTLRRLVTNQAVPTLRRLVTNQAVPTFRRLVTKQAVPTLRRLVTNQAVPTLRRLVTKQTVPTLRRLVTNPPRRKTELELRGAHVGIFGEKYGSGTGCCYLSSTSLFTLHFHFRDSPYLYI